MDTEEKLALLKRMGLKPSLNFEQTREKVFRPGKRSYWDSVVNRSYEATPSERSIRKAKSLIGQRNVSRRK